MRETNSQGKAYVVPLAVVAGLGMVGMGLVSSRVVAADITSITDTLSLTVEETCTFKNTSDATFTGSALKGSEVDNFNDSGIHTFYLFCNGNDGYTVSATPYDLEATNTEDIISYTDNYTHTGTNGMWTAAIATSESGVTVTSPVPVGGDVILSSNTHSSDSMSFTATYSAYVGSRTPAGTYTGTIEYTLSSLSGTASNSDNNGGGDNSNANSGNEVTDNTGNGGDSGDTGSGDSGSGGTGSGDVNPDANPGGSNNTQSNEPSNAPLAMTSNSYSTYNTYNTTNYTNSGTGTTDAQVATNGGTSDATSGNNSNKGGSTTNDGYENPLGVTTTTSSSNEDSGIDPMPIIATGAALAVAGVAAIALARSNKEEE